MELKKTILIIFIILMALTVSVGGWATPYPGLDPAVERAAVKKLKEDIKMIGSDKNAVIGVAIATDTEEVLTINDHVRFSLMSVFKFHIALAVLDKLDKNNTSLDSLIFIERSRLKHDTYSPMIKLFPDQDITISIGDLIKYCVSQSDNNACDFLIEYAGGIGNIENYIKSLGVKNFNLSVTERVMHDDIMKQYVNWTTPSSTIDLMRIFLMRPLFSEEYKDFLIRAMSDTQTGKNKIKALLPPGTFVGHKTGSSNRTVKGIQIAENDIAFIYLPDGKRYYISVFVKDSLEDDATNVAIIARISKVVYDFFSEK